MKTQIILLSFFFTSMMSCEPQASKQKTTEKSDSISSVAINKIDLLESIDSIDEPNNEFLTEELQSVRDNFKRINAIKSWTQVEDQASNESSEGGEIKYCYNNKVLEKIICRNYGETQQSLVEYYLLNEQLSFVIEKTLEYNRPLGTDSNRMKENNDVEVFDISKSEVMEDRSYFLNGKLVHQINNQDCGAPFEESYLKQEEKRIMSTFNTLMRNKDYHKD